MSNSKNSSIDPVVIVTLGVVLIAVAFALIAFQPSGAQTIASASGTWSQIVVAFVTGISTGGLSCLAMQGGLLASSLARQIEQDYTEQAAAHHHKHGKSQPVARQNSALPIFLFLLAKLVAYTLLGALLGWLGSFLSLSPMTRAMLMIFIGIFMVGMSARWKSPIAFLPVRRPVKKDAKGKTMYPTLATGRRRKNARNPGKNKKLNPSGKEIDGIEYKNGFPDFGDLTVPAGAGKKAQVEIMQAGNHTSDYKAADEALQAATGKTQAMLEKELGTPLTWHHKEDGVTMQLVPQYVHGGSNGSGHAGGASLTSKEEF